MANLVDKNNIKITEGFYQDTFWDVVRYVTADPTAKYGFRIYPYFGGENVEFHFLIAGDLIRLQSPKEKEKELRRKSHVLSVQADFIANKLEKLVKKKQ